MLDGFIFILCGIVLPLFLLITGLRYGWRLRFFYILHPVRTAKEIKSGKGGFSALSLALAGTLGIGNIAGVASAIIMGGPGAVFWMILSACIAMGVKYGETFFAMRYKKIHNGTAFGGAPYYIKKVFPNKQGAILSLVFSFLCIGNSLITGNLVQINAVKDISPLNPLTLGGIFAILLLVVILKGVDKISTLTSLIIPFLTLAHTFLSLCIILRNYQYIPTVFSEIITEAFNFRSALSGVGAFSILTAIRYGVSRGILSNEAGCGTSPIAHASSDNPPHIQGCLGIFEVFVDTVLLCTITALVILIYGQRDLSPIEWVSQAYGHYFPSFGEGFIIVSCLIYVFSTLISQFYYGDKSLSYITESKSIHTLFALLSAAVCIISTLIPSEIMWLISDLNIALLTVFNLIALNLLINKLK
ncbi:MAG: sodium:alanine symporter family protein [Clostridia bacterium]|nr:sodium:alanine symporter family protein [Clostridia bacterium]